jgi:hypothetical protein
VKKIGVSGERRIRTRRSHDERERGADARTENDKVDVALDENWLENLLAEGAIRAGGIPRSMASSHDPC